MVRYVAVRHFFASGTALRAAFSDPAGAGINTSEIINPLVDEAGDAGPLADPATFEAFERTVRRSSQAPASVLSAVSYTRAILEARFSDAYQIWLQFPAVGECLEHLPTPRAPAGTAGSIAVVLPGPATNSFGAEIDGHSLVARTSFGIPDPSQVDLLGSRYDIAFLNRDRFRLIERGEASPPAGRVVTKPSDAGHVTGGTGPSGVEFGLVSPSLPTSQYTFLPLVLVPWCFRADLKPTLYNADFYLGSEIYQDATYDPKALLNEAGDIIRSYLRHDVFFTHAALQKWALDGHLVARGTLGDILDWDGAEFAAALERKWQKVLAQES